MQLSKQALILSLESEIQIQFGGKISNWTTQLDLEAPIAQACQLTLNSNKKKLRFFSRNRS